MSLIFDAEIDPAELAGRRVTILGLGKGRTTAGLARWLVERGAQVTVTDPKPKEHLGEGLRRLDGVPVQLVLGPSGDDVALADPDLVFLIPGVRPRSPTVTRAMQRGIPVLTEIGLFFRLCPAPIIGVTGTKGKTTTTTLIGRMLERGARRVLVGGNIGSAVIQELPRLAKDDLVVLELSSFQLETLGRSPHVAVVTNVLEEHLDHHGTREAYVAAKANIVRWQGARDVAVLNLDDPAALAIHTGATSQVRGFTLALRPKSGGYLDESGRLMLSDGERVAALCRADELRVTGRHNVANALAAAVAAAQVGIPSDEIAEVLRGFEGLPHRLEAVGERDGVLWVNDSQGTTPFATIPALAAYERPAVVILGGVSKNADFGPLARACVERARAAVLIGQAADEIAAALEVASRAAGRGPEVQRAGSLEDAVARARRLARSGDVVLLSPACASFDMFASYEERGDRFRELVRGFATPVGSAA
jgi:UDP-N-acetylmuramoylalanine--D-glutamate ligase